MRLKELEVEGIAVFAISGEVDLHFAPALRSLFAAKVKARCPALILDLSGVDYIDSTGLATLIEYFRDASEYGGVLCLAGLNEKLKPVFDIVRFDQVLSIFPTVDEAVKAIQQGRVLPPPSAHDRSVA
ncbi:MAG: STAS domain-containing protein [Verrucomicrobiota bacterium]|nr:STAS domain-containing protein [Verrucomicrobiota bacterium]